MTLYKACKYLIPGLTSILFFAACKKDTAIQQPDGKTHLLNDSLYIVGPPVTYPIDLDRDSISDVSLKFTYSVFQNSQMEDLTLFALAEDIQAHIKYSGFPIAMDSLMEIRDRDTAILVALRNCEPEDPKLSVTINGYFLALSAQKEFKGSFQKLESEVKIYYAQYQTHIGPFTGRSLKTSLLIGHEPGVTSSYIHFEKAGHIYAVKLKKKMPYLIIEAIIRLS